MGLVAEVVVVVLQMLLLVLETIPIDMVSLHFHLRVIDTSRWDDLRHTMIEMEKEEKLAPLLPLLLVASV